ncbi:glycoside hydrolase family 19 protein, partial [Orbus sasakiae]|uniref:glycoside hydrolase family 19 protein n=1 Tax=Orbus sasakiae TaxID=1078475 RepID=UPI003CD0538E
LLNAQYQSHIDTWQIEKAQRIKPSLWWDEVAKAQASQTANTDTATTDNTPVLSNLSLDGKAWYLHPVGMGEFIVDDSLITLEMLIAAHPSGSKSYYNEILPYLNQYALAYELTEPKEIAHFLSQIAHESGFKSDNEQLSFSASRMKQVYGCKGGEKKYNPITDSCDLGQLRPKLWTSTSYYERNPENLGNYVYANKMGNGNEASGDGYRYRGRGMIQLTGKDAYDNFTRVHNRNNPDDIQDFVLNPDLLMSSIQYGIESAFVFWFTKTGKPNRNINHYVKLQDLAKSGTVQEVTQIVNGGQNGYNDRKQRFNRLARLFGLNEE